MKSHIVDFLCLKKENQFLQKCLNPQSLTFHYIRDLSILIHINHNSQ